MNRMYRWHFHFNALHNMVPEQDEQKHMHSFLVVACMEVEEIEVELQNSCEQAIKQYLLRYRGKYLNKLDEFKEMLPTIENICEVLYEAIGQIAHHYGTRLVQMEVGDSPVAMYSIGERLLLGSDYREISEDSYLKYKKEFGTK